MKRKDSKKEKVTIEDIGKDIHRVEKAVEGLAVITKKGFDEVRVEMDSRFDEVDERFNEVDERFNKMDEKLDRIENILIQGHENRIERLEDNVRQIMVSMGKK